MVLFDIDQTLYRHDAYYHSQTQDQIVWLARRWNRRPEDLEAEMEAFRQEYQRLRGGRKPSLGNLLLQLYGIPIAESVEIRRQALRPEHYLSPDLRLADTLARLGQSARLGCLTNNPSDLGRRTLAALGVEGAFEQVFGLEHSGHSKPHPEAFAKALGAWGVEPADLVMVGDRYEVDLEEPLARGCAAILVESMEDVYALPEVLIGKS